MNENLVEKLSVPSPLFLFFPFFEKFNTLLRLHYSIRWLVVFRHDLSKMDFNGIKFREETNIFKSCVRIQPIFFPFYFHLSSNVILLISRFNLYLFILPDNVSVTYREHDYRERSRNSKTLSLYNRITKSRFEETERCENTDAGNFALTCRQVGQVASFSIRRRRIVVASV